MNAKRQKQTNAKEEATTIKTLLKHNSMRSTIIRHATEVTDHELPTLGTEPG